MRISLQSFSRYWDVLKNDVNHAVNSFGESGYYILGKNVAEFEKNLAILFNAKYAVGCAYGLDAIEISLRVLGLNPGDKVLTTPLSAFATTLAIVKAGGVPVFVDTDMNGLIDLELAREALTKHQDIKWFVPVHLYGHCLNLDKLKKLKEDFNLKIVEDCAQSILATWNNQSCGTVGECAATSFYPTKNLGCFGDGGALLTSIRTIENKAKNLRDYGQTAKYEHTFIGMNSRLDEMQAAIMNAACLPKLLEWTEKRRSIAKKYLHNIDNTLIKLPTYAKESNSVWHIFHVLVEDRTRFMEYLSQKGIQVSIHYPKLIHKQDAINDVAFELYGGTKIAEYITNCEVSLPLNPFMTEDEISYIINICNKFV